MAPPHLSLGTQNDVPMATYIQLSKCREGAAVVTFSLLGSSAVRTLRMTEIIPAEKFPSISKDNFGAFVAVCQKNFFKYSSRPRSPALIDLLILLLFTHSAFATCEILMPRK